MAFFYTTAVSVARIHYLALDFNSDCNQLPAQTMQGGDDLLLARQATILRVK